MGKVALWYVPPTKIRYIGGALIVDLVMHILRFDLLRGWTFNQENRIFSDELAGRLGRKKYVFACLQCVFFSFFDFLQADDISSFPLCGLPG